MVRVFTNGPGDLDSILGQLKDKKKKKKILKKKGTLCYLA